MLTTLRKTIGRLALVGGAGLLVFQVVQWRQQGIWTAFPLGILLEGFMRLIGTLMGMLPFVTPEGVEMFLYFDISQLPGVLHRFFLVLPLSGFLLVLGYFCLRWEKYLG
ncbi:MAG: hypothetical protein HYZ11_14325 [Candidatus Tectomicrobia bacterium]|uniref:Uncharacterized protein n=1 Tax=Tectimicrobiota bacterium TaxID=2528274 RepID=A0A932I2W5_UNCTE|nr:hypothetical protein [Candidatus Tectomicrobia bacterium]